MARERYNEQEPDLYGDQSGDFYYDPNTGEFGSAPAASTTANTTVSGIGNPAVTTAAQSAETTALTPQQIADLQASAALMQSTQTGPNMFNAAGGLGSLQGGTLSEFDPLYDYASNGPVLTLQGNKESENLRFQPRPGQMYRLIVNGQDVGSGNTPEGVANLVAAANQISKEGGANAKVRLQQEVNAMVDGRPQNVFVDAYVNDPNLTLGKFAKIAVPLALAAAGGIFLGPVIAPGIKALGLAAGVGAGTTAGNLLVGQSLGQSLKSGLTAAATAYGGAALGPLIGAGSVGVGAGAAGANLAANLAQGRSVEESFKSAALAGVTAGVMHALTSGGASKTGDYTSGEMRAAEELSKATGLKIAPVKGYVLNTGGSLSTPNAAANLSLADAARVVANVGSLSGVEEAIIVTARSLGLSLADASSAAISSAITQAFQSVNPSEVAKAKEDATKAVDDAAAKVRQEEIARMGSDSDAKINARQAGFPEGYEVFASGPSAGNAVIGDAGAQIVSGLRGDVVDQNGNVIARNWFDLSDADKAALVAKAKSDADKAALVAKAKSDADKAALVAKAKSDAAQATVQSTATNNDAAAAAAALAAAAAAGGGGAAPPANVTSTATNNDAVAAALAAAAAAGGGGAAPPQTVTGDGDKPPPPPPTVEGPRPTRTVRSILDLGTPQEVLSTRRIRELLGLTPTIGSETFEAPLELETPYDVKTQRLRNQIGLPAGLGTTFIDEALDLGPREIRVTGRRTPISVSATPGSPRTLSEELNVPSLDDIINVVRQRAILSAAPVITPATTARSNINVEGEKPIDVKGERQPLNILPPGSVDPVKDILGDSQDKPSTKKRILSTLKKIGGLTPLLRLLAEAVDGGGDGEGGTINRGTGYTVPQGRRTLGTFDDDPFTYGQRSGELRFFNNSTGGATTGIGGGATTGGTTAGGATGTTAGTGGGATSTPGPAATAAEVQAAYPGYTNIRQDAQGRWFGEPIPGYTASGTPATGLRVTAGGTFDPTVADYQALNPGFETIERNEAGEYVGVRTETIPGSPGMTEAQVRAQFPGYASYEKDAAGKWVGTRAAQAQSPVTLEQVRAANPGFDSYEQDASGQWFGIKNPTTTAGRAATEADARAQNPGYDAYTKDANGQWIGVKNIAATTSGLLTEAEVRAANPGYSSYEKDADGQWVGIKNIETRTPRAVTLDQVRAQYGANYDTITQNEAGRFVGTKTIPGQDTSMTLDEIRAAFPQYNRIEQLPTGDYVGITDVTEEVPFTLAQAQEKFGSQYSNIRPGQQGQYIGTRATTRPITVEDVRGLGLGYSDFEQDEAGNFYGITNVETRAPRPLTMADYEAKFGSQYSSIRQNPQGQFVGIGSRPTQVLPTIADAQRQYGSAYDAFEQGEGGIYGLKNVEERAPGAPFTLADAVAKYGSQYSNIYQNDQGQFVGETTETEEPNMAEGGEVNDDMVSHLIAYRKGGGHMGPGKVKGIGSGQEDKIPAWLSDGEYVWSAQDVADLGDGSTDEGVRRLDRMRKMVRQRAGRKDVKKIAKPQRGIEDMLKAVGGAV